MTVFTDINDAINEIHRRGFAKITIAGQVVEFKSVDELIKAKQYLDAQNATNTNSMGVRLRRIQPKYR